MDYIRSGHSLTAQRSGSMPRRGHGPPTAIPVRDWGEELVVHRGLSMSLHEHSIDVVRDEDTHTATIRVKRERGNTQLTDELAKDLAEAADLLASRAQRTLGAHWTISRWDGHLPGYTVEQPVGRVFGLHTTGSGV